MNRTRVMAGIGAVVVGAILAGCGGNSTGNATISGTVTGLAAGTSVSIANNGGTAIVLSSTGTSPINFAFSNTVASNDGYKVLVTAQPTNQTCVVNNGSGTIDFAGNNVSDVSVVCAANVAIGVNVTGLNSGNQATFTLTLNNDALNYTSENVSSNNTLENFPTTLPLGTIYSVTVSAQPGQTAVAGTATTPPTATGTAKQTCTAAAGASGGVVSLAAPITVNFVCQ